MFDLKKAFPEYYKPTTAPLIVNPPPMLFLSIKGKGNPNEPDGDYAKAVAALYSISYTIKMNYKHMLEFVVAPLEGLWEVDDENFTGGEMIKDKSKFKWELLIRQPEFVSMDNNRIFEVSCLRTQEKKRDLPVEEVKLISWAEGTCVQAMHVGPYDEELETLAKMKAYAESRGFIEDMAVGRRHHEIYISDPRKTKSERLNTILRHPVKPISKEGTEYKCQP